MANIHTLRDLRNQTGPPPRAPASSSSSSSSAAPPSSSSSRPPTSSSSNNASSGSRFATIANFRQDPHPQQQQQQQLSSAPYSQYEPGKLGMSLVSPPLNADGTMPGWMDRCYPNRSWRSLTALFIIINTILFVITLIVAKANYGSAFVKTNNMGGPGADALLGMGADSFTHVYQDKEVWRLFTCIWLHAGVLHILFNMFMLSRFGFSLELRWERWRFLVIYVMTGIASSMWSCALNHNTVSVGASGALFGIVGADVAYLIYNFVEIPDGKQEACFLTFVIVINLLFGISSSDSHVDNYAHLGGLVTGLPAAIWICPTLVKRERELWFRIGGAVVYIGLFLLFALLIGYGS